MTNSEQVDIPVMRLDDLHAAAIEASDVSWSDETSLAVMSAMKTFVKLGALRVAPEPDWADREHPQPRQSNRSASTNSGAQNDQQD